MKASALLYAASETDADILYPTGFFAPDPFLFVELGGRRILVASDLEIDRARKQATVDRVRSWSRVARRLEREGKRPSAAQVIARVMRDLGERRAVVPRSFPLGLAMELDELGLRLELGGEPFWPEREMKRPAEVRAIEAALRAAEAGLEAGIVVAPGLPYRARRLPPARRPPLHRRGPEGRGEHADHGRGVRAVPHHLRARRPGRGPP